MDHKWLQNHARRMKNAPLDTDMDKLGKLINEEKSQAEEHRHQVIKLQTEKTLKEQKLKEMTSKVKSKNQQVNSMANFISRSLDAISC